MRRARNLCVVLGLVLCLCCGPAWAVTIGFNPSSQTVTPDAGNVTVDVVISGFGDSGVGAFDIVVSFIPEILALTGYSLGSLLGDLEAGDAQVVSSSSPGMINLAEVSNVTDPSQMASLISSQGSLFTLATLIFDPVAEGFSPLILAAGSEPWSDLLWAEPLDFSFEGGSITVAAPVPEPSTLLLLGSGLAGLLASRRKFRAAC